MRALVLSGGGAKGAYEAGAITSLWQSQPFDILVGTSIGAINASITAQGDITRLQAVWQSIAARGVIQPLPTVAHVEAFLQAFSDWQTLPIIARASHIPHLLLLWAQIGSKAALFNLLGLFDQAPIAAILKEFADYNSLKATLIFAATDITTKTATAFYAFAGAAVANQSSFLEEAGMQTAPLSQLNYVEALEASAAIPAAFTPVEMNLGSPPTKFFVDGGVANNTPIGLAVAAGADDVTVIFLDPKAPAALSAPPRNIADIGFACYDVMQQKILEDDLKLAGLTNAALKNPGGASVGVQEHLVGKKPIALRYVRPTTELPVSVLDFSDQVKLNAAFQRGIEDGKNPTAF
jgi:NTE family protein